MYRKPRKSELKRDQYTFVTRRNAPKSPNGKSNNNITRAINPAKARTTTILNEENSNFKIVQNIEEWICGTNDANGEE